MASIKLPFSLERPSETEPVANASDIGINLESEGLYSHDVQNTIKDINTIVGGNDQFVKTYMMGANGKSTTVTLIANNTSDAYYNETYEPNTLIDVVVTFDEGNKINIQTDDAKGLGFVNVYENIESGKTYHVNTLTSGIIRIIAESTASEEGAEVRIVMSIPSVSDTRTQVLSNTETINNLQSNIDSEGARAKGAEVTLQSSIETETSRATGEEATLQTNIDSEISRAKDAEKTLQGNVDAEVSRATGAENTLQSNVDTVQGNLNAETERAKTAEGNNATAISDEEARARAAEEANASAITKEATDRGSADSTLQTNIDNEATARSNADNTLQTNIDAEVSRATAAENAIDTRITNMGLSVQDGLLCVTYNS